jgi:hypothetical protein
MIDCCSTPYQGKNELLFNTIAAASAAAAAAADDDDVVVYLDKHVKMSFCRASSLKQQVDMFVDNQSLLLLVNLCALLSSKYSFINTDQSS